MIRLFAHRGFTAGKLPQNSIASLKQAYESGFRCVEFDIWWFENKLVLKHDVPLKGEDLPKFSDYLCYGNEIIYWCDFKNLSEENTDEALKKIKENLEEALIDLDQIYFAPFITDYKLARKIFKKIIDIFGAKAKLVAVCEDKKVLDELRDFLTEAKIKNLSIFHKIIDRNFRKKFHDIEIFAWTVNDLKRLHELESLEVKNFATDKITPQDYEGKPNPAA